MIDKIQNIKNVPELRFPEFSGEWVEKKLGDITKISQGLQIPISERFLEQVDNSYFYITNEFLKKNSTKTYFIKNPSLSVLCTEEDVLMTRTGNTGQVVTGVSGAFHNNFFKIKFDLEIVIKDFLVYFLRLYKTQCRILRLAGASTIPDLNHSDFYRIKISYPNIKEQKKIANFLMQVDRRIDKLEEKKVKLEEYKKGVMQKIFSQEIRFKDDNGEDFPDWEKKRLGDILNYIQPTKYLVSNTEYDDSYNIPVLTAGKTFILGYTNESTGIFQKELPTIIFDDFTTAFKYVDFAFKAKSSAMKMLIPNSLDVNLRFIYESMKFIKFPLSEHKRYWISEFQNEKINYPSFNEQYKIGNFITSLNKQIEKISSQIECSKIFKTGLLQKMYV